MFKEAEAKQHCIETNNIQNTLFVSEKEWKIFFDIPEILNQDKILLADSDTCISADALSLFDGKNTMIFIDNSIDEDEIIERIKNYIKTEYNMVFCMEDYYFSLYSCTVKWIIFPLIIILPKKEFVEESVRKSMNKLLKKFHIFIFPVLIVCTAIFMICSCFLLYQEQIQNKKIEKLESSILSLQNTLASKDSVAFSNNCSGGGIIIWQ